MTKQNKRDCGRGEPECCESGDSPRSSLPGASPAGQVLVEARQPAPLVAVRPWVKLRPSRADSGPMMPLSVATRRMTRIMSGAAKNGPAKYHKHPAATGQMAFHSSERMPAMTATRKIAARKISPTKIHVASVRSRQGRRSSCGVGATTEGDPLASRVPPKGAGTSTAAPSSGWALRAGPTRR